MMKSPAHAYSGHGMTSWAWNKHEKYLNKTVGDMSKECKRTRVWQTSTTRPLSSLKVFSQSSPALARGETGQLCRLALGTTEAGEASRGVGLL